MRTKVLGRTGIEVSIVGLGTAFTGMPIVDATAGTYEELAADINDEIGTQTVHAALEAGCTLIDTAALYGGGRSESIIGRALAARPDLAAKTIVTTKVGRTLEGQNYSYDAILRSIETSQQRLGLEHFEVVYIHDAMNVPMEQVMGKNAALGALRRLQDEGIVRFVGTAADDPRTNARYIQTGEFDAAVVPRAWSLINQFAAEHILPAAEKHNVGLVIATSLERGLLATGPISGASYFDRNYSAACQDHVAKIQEFCQQHGLSLLAVAIQWCTRHPQIATTIPGARFPSEAIANAQAAEVDIPESFWGELEPLIRHWNDASNFS
jgi:D-threo-aldose 1-dehydrogenase